LEVCRASNAKSFELLHRAQRRSMGKAENSLYFVVMCSPCSDPPMRLFWQVGPPLLVSLRCSLRVMLFSGCVADAFIVH
jgi:hypothetical protein